MGTRIEGPAPGARGGEGPRGDCVAPAREEVKRQLTSRVHSLNLLICLQGKEEMFGEDSEGSEEGMLLGSEMEGLSGLQAVIPF